ncbi:MAG: hypothetical protein IJY27_06665 [Clostridia bacterium]|nr:hypothetical protein [Clostridia bacterium]
MNKDESKAVKNKILRVLRRYAPRVGMFLLAVALMAFVLYHSLGLEQVQVDTIAAVRSVEYEISGLTGYIFRDEQVVYSQNSGAATYLVEDGERVAAHTELARVYKTGNTADYLAERARIESRIKLIERAISLGVNNAGGIDNTRTALGESYAALMSALGRGKLDTAAALSDDFFVALSASALINGGDDALRAELVALQNELNMLTGSYGGAYESISNEASCYFFYSVDGYENIFDISLLDTLDASGLRALAASQPQSVGAGVPVGKFVHDYEWFMAMSAGRDVCERLEQGRYYEMTLSGGLTLDMYLERLDIPAVGDGIMIFSCGEMPEGFDYAREQSVELLIDTVAGYRVPTGAIYSQKGLDGVYVLSSSEVIFRRVTILYRGDGYVVVAERDYTTENYDEFLNLNDQIILSVSDGELYDGRILD